MIFLPIVDRELRVAARKRSTFWVRISAALVAFLIAGGFLVLAQSGAMGAGTTSLGKGLFLTLTWMSLAAALSAGLFLTSDCLSEEKREGTLGFLFLTDLRGFDVVLGKMLASSLRGVCALLAVFPILAVTLLMGGVSGDQFWRAMLALLNALFFSLSMGLLVSSLSRDSQKALGMTFLVLLLFVAGGPSLDGVLAAWKQRAFEAQFSLASPGYLFVSASSWRPPDFWQALIVNQVVAWTVLGLACLLLPRAWQEKVSRRSGKTGGFGQRWKYGGTRRRARLREKLINVNAVLWLACRERWQAVTLWVFTVLLMGSLAALWISEGSDVLWMVAQSVGGLVTLVVYVGMASQATRFFVEAKGSGLVELLLGTPLTGKQIVQGNWRALLRMYGPPIALFLVTLLVISVVGQYRMYQQVTAATPPPTTMPANTTTNAALVVTNQVIVSPTGSATVASVTVSTPGTGFNAPGLLATIGSSIASILTTALNLAAIVWFGMWMGLTSKSTNLATLKTIAFVQILPWFVLAFASALIVPLLLLPRLMSGTNPGNYVMWFPLLTTLLALLLNGAKDAAFIVWSRNRLYNNFREQALRVTAPVPKDRQTGKPVR